MNIFLKIVTLTLVVAFSSCNKEKEKPKVIYENPVKAQNTVKADTTSVTLVDLPIQMQGTNYLLFPVGELRTTGSMYDAASKGGQLSYKVSNYSEYQLTGFMRNIKFQQVGKDTITALTDKNILIQSVTYLKTLADKTKQQILVYELEDMDTNKDIRLDDSDIKSLYMSDISGNRFTKVSVDLQELIDWNLVESLNRLYYRTIEDTNKNGAFEKNDKLHYFYVDLTLKKWESKEYNPN
jgi:hypothetical protein